MPSMLVSDEERAQEWWAGGREYGWLGVRAMGTYPPTRSESVGQGNCLEVLHIVWE